MTPKLNSKVAQFGLVAGIFAVVTIAVAIGTGSAAPLATAVVWLPAMYVAIYHRSAGRRGQGRHT